MSDHRLNRTQRKILHNLAGPWLAVGGFPLPVIYTLLIIVFGMALLTHSLLLAMVNTMVLLGLVARRRKFMLRRLLFDNVAESGLNKIPEAPYGLHWVARPIPKGHKLGLALPGTDIPVIAVQLRHPLVFLRNLIREQTITDGKVSYMDRPILVPPEPESPTKDWPCIITSPGKSDFNYAARMLLDFAHATHGFEHDPRWVGPDRNHEVHIERTTKNTTVHYTFFMDDEPVTHPDVAPETIEAAEHDATQLRIALISTTWPAWFAQHQQLIHAAEQKAVDREVRLKQYQTQALIEYATHDIQSRPTPERD